MATELAKAYVQIIPSAQGIQGNLSKALEGEATSAGKSAGEKFSAGFGGSIGDALTAAGIATVIEKSLAALKKLIQETAEYGDNVDKMSQKMGISTTAYQEWEAVMEHCGTSMETLKSSMKTLASAAVTGKDAFDRLGISQAEIAQMSQEELFTATIAALQNVSDETERTYIAGQLLGRGATELGALLNLSAEETQNMRDRVHELGGVMSDEAVKNAAAFSDSLQDFTTAAQGLGREIGSTLLPGLTGVLDVLTEGAVVLRSYGEADLGGAESMVEQIRILQENQEKWQGIAKAAGPLGAIGSAFFGSGGSIISNIAGIFMRSGLSQAAGQLQELQASEEVLIYVQEQVTSGTMDFTDAASLLGLSGSELARKLRALADAEREGAGAAAELTEEELAANKAALETHEAIIDLTSEAYNAKYSGDDLRESYESLSKELETLRETGDEADIMLAEQALASLNLAATNQELVESLGQIPGALSGIYGSTVSFSQFLIDAGVSAEDFAADVTAMRESVVNDFNLLSEGQKTSMAEMGTALSGNKATMEQWNTDIVALWKQAQADSNTEAMAYVRYLATLGPEYASAVHEFTQGGYDELVSQATTWSEIGTLSAQMVAEGIYADEYLAGDAASQMGQDAMGEAEGVTGWTEAGTGWDTETAGGIDSGAGEVSAAAVAAATGARDAANGVAGWYLVGRSYSKGIADGVSGGSYLIRQAAISAAQSALAAAKAALDINSPSKKARDIIGLGFDEGVAAGIEKGVPMVASASADMARSLIDDSLIRGNLPEIELERAVSADRLYASGIPGTETPDIDTLTQIVSMLGVWLPQLASRQVTLDTGQTVGALAPAMDRALGTRESAAKRGNA